MVAILSISFILTFIFNSQMDKIKFEPTGAWFKSSWWLSNNWQTKNWLLKVPFSFLLDGWHFCKSVQTYSYLMPLSLIICNQFSINIYWSFSVNIIPYAIGGIIWQIFYKI